MKIVVLAGGLSAERNVSLASGTAACRALRSRGHRAILVDMFMGLADLSGTDASIFDAPDGLCSDVSIDACEPDLDAVRAARGGGVSMFGKNVLRVCAMADVVFLALHGACGEDGRVQAAFDLLGIPYTGSGFLPSGLAMNKAHTKRIMESAGIRTPEWRDVFYGEADIERLSRELPVPCAVKTVDGGSSIGVRLVESRDELADALRHVLRYGNHVVVERMVRGRELTVGILGERYLPAVEIIPQDAAYFDYQAKYQQNGAKEVCPADITDAQQRAMGEAALALHRALGLSVYSRADFILDENGDAYCLETNTLPGMSPMSLLPKEAAAIGMDYAALCEAIVEESLKIKRI
ncbi:MAG: D-alanine--D-alanine ligase [Oscillospiraceae bacterium]|nr:D-alanine--D-alanine ligase [Oscillospiraceae bacterium]